MNKKTSKKEFIATKFETISFADGDIITISAGDSNFADWTRDPDGENF